MKAKLAKIAIYGFTGLLFLMAGVYTVLLSPPVQLWITQKFTAQLSEQLHTKVTLSGVDFRFFSTIVLEDLLVEGYNKDTMLYVQVLKADLKKFNGKKQQIDLNQFVLNGVQLNFIKYEGDSDFNYETAMEYINAEAVTDTTTEFKPWTITAKSVLMEGGKFTYRDRNLAPPDDRIFDENYLEFDHILAHLTNFKLINDSLNFHSKHLECKERSGLLVEHMKGDVIISRTTMHYSDLLLQTPHSHITNDLLFEYTSYDDMSDFISAVYMVGDFKKAYIDFDDLKLFSNELANFDERIYLDGKLRGTVDNFRGKDISAAFGKNSKFVGDVNFNGLPNIDETFIDIKFKNTFTNEADIKHLIKDISLPDNFKYFGNIGFNGYFTGFYNDFVAYGLFNTDIGQIRSDLNLKIKGEGKNAEYSGNFAAYNFDLGTFYDLGSSIGAISLNAKIKGEGFTVDNFDINMEGNVNSFLAGGYNYKNVAIKGQVTKNLFTGSALVNDENGHVDFNGTVDFAGEQPIMNFTADLNGLDLKALKLEPSTNSFNVKLIANFQGSSIDDLNGSLSFKDLSFRHENKKYSYEEGILSANIKDGRRSLKLTSDMVDASIDGEYNIENLATSVEELVASYIPYIVKPKNIKLPKEDFTFSAQLKKPKEFSELFLDGINVGAISASGHYNSQVGNLRLDAGITHIKQGNYDARGVSVLFEKVADSTLQARVLVDQFYDGDSLISADINIYTKIIPNDIDFDIKIRDTSQTIAAYMKGNFRFESDSTVSTVFRSADLYLEHQKWQITTPQPIFIEPNKLIFNDFKMVHEEQSLSVNGVASDAYDTLNIEFTQFNFFDMRKLIDYDGPELGGIANGNLSIMKVLATPYIVADVDVKDFSLDNDTLGDFSLVSSTTNVPEQLKISVKSESGQLKNFTVRGLISYAKSATNNMDLKINLPVTAASILEHFLDEEVTFTGGFIAAELGLKGKFDAPQVTGDVKFIKTKFRYDFTNTEYTFSQNVVLTDRNIDLGKFDLIDDQGKVAKVEGNISHKNYDNFNFNIFVSDLKDYHVLNTGYPNNPGFYGNAYADGNMRVTGPLEDVTIDIYAKSKPGSWVSISVEDDESVSQSSYITFVKPDTFTQTKKVAAPLITGVNLNITLELTEDMQGGIVFDRGAGDSISGFGSGNLNLKINTYGDFTMYGSYEIDNGEYAFTALDFIKRKFKIKKGSRIAWSGDPYEAILDITAIYRTTAQLSVLTAGVVSTRDADAYNVNVPVEALLIIKGSLTQPDISFNIDFDKLETEIGNRTSTSDLSAIFNRIKNNQDELNRQVFSLLVLNSFAPPTFAQNSSSSGIGASAVSNNVSQFISNQLTNMLAQYSKDFEIGLDYYAGSADRNQEIILSLKKSIGRFEFKGAVDAANTSQNTSYNVNVDFNITRDGKFKARAYNSSSNHPIFNTNVNNLGIGLFFKREFEHFGDLFRRKEETTTD